MTSFDDCVPARGTPSRSILLTAAVKLAALWRRLRRRQRLRYLLDLDDAILEDIGLTRAEVAWATRLPLATNAALALQERAQLRRRPERQRPRLRRRH